MAVEFPASVLLNGQRYYGTMKYMSPYVGFASYDQRFMIVVHNDFQNLKIEREQ